MKIPYFESSGKDTPKKGLEFVKRRNIYVILEHPTQDKYCLLDWKHFLWKSLIVGGIEDKEELVEAAKREVIEETGYTDFGETRIMSYEIHGAFYAEHKKINRYSIERYVYLKLNSLNNIGVDPKEVENHDFLWVEKNKVEDFINLDNHKYAWRLFLDGKQEDEEYLKKLNTFKGFIND